jgi:hypothetical protein
MSSLDSALIAIERACGSGSVIRDPSLLEGYAQDESEAEPCMPEAAEDLAESAARFRFRAGSSWHSRK